MTKRHMLAFLLAVAGSAQGLCAERYTTRFSAHLDPESGDARVTITVEQPEHRLRMLDLAAPGTRFSNFRGDGDVGRKDGRVVWQLPESGGSLSFTAKIDHRRGEAYDARITEDWAVLRLDDLFPAARTTTSKGAKSNASLTLSGPPGWSFETRYGPFREEGLAVKTPGRRFSRPTGWLVAGKLGVRRDEMADRTLTIAGPRNQGLRRLDTLAFLRWNLPDLLAVFPDLPDYLLVVRAGAEMWRGGLSGPASLYLHADRPLISENATSTLLHEFIHMATGEHAKRRDDWVMEGLAEYYSLETLRRSGGISAQRHEQALEKLRAWAERENGRLKSPSTGPHTARAVTVLEALRQELAAAASAGTAHAGGIAAKAKESAEPAGERAELDGLVAGLLDSGELTGERLAELARKALGHDSVALTTAPGGPPAAGS